MAVGCWERGKVVGERLGEVEQARQELVAQSLELGNSGRGDLPYQPTTYTPNDCIRLNHGDFNACNVGNSGRGDLP